MGKSKQLNGELSKAHLGNFNQFECRFRDVYDGSLAGEYGHADDVREITLAATDLAIHKVKHTVDSGVSGLHRYSPLRSLWP